MGNSAKVIHKTQKLRSKFVSSFISVDISMKCIKLYAIPKSRPKLNFGGYLTFEFTFEAVNLDNFDFLL